MSVAAMETMGASDEDLVLMQRGFEGGVCPICGDSEAGVRQAVQARSMMRVWQALVSDGIVPTKVERVYAGLLHEFAPTEAASLCVEFEMASRSVVAGLLETCESGVCEYCDLDPGAVEQRVLRGCVRRVLLEPLQFGLAMGDVVRTMLVRMKELRPELVSCATGEALGALLGYKEGARRAGVSAATRRVLNTPVEAQTGHAARFGRQKTPGMREACARAQQGNGNRRSGVLKAMVKRVFSQVQQQQQDNKESTI